MMQRWFKGTRRTPIGVDVSHRSLRALQFEHGGARLAAAARMVRETPGAAVSAAELTRFAQGLSRAGFQGSRVVASAPPDALLTAMLDLPPRSSGAPIHQLMRTELARVHKLDPEQIEAGGWDVPGLGRTNEATHMMAVGMARDRAESLFSAFQEAGLTLVAIEARSCALARGTMNCVERPPTAGAPTLTGILELGWNAALLVVMAGDAIVYDRVMPEAGVERLMAAAKSRVGFDTDTTLLTLSNPGGGLSEGQALSAAQSALLSELRGCLTAFLELLVPETEQALAYVSHRHNTSVGTLSIVGEGAAFPAVLGGLTNALKAELACPTVQGASGIDLSAYGGELLVAAGLSLHEVAARAHAERRAA